jgi:hypothetical protein
MAIYMWSLHLCHFVTICKLGNQEMMKSDSQFVTSAILARWPTYFVSKVMNIFVIATNNKTFWEQIVIAFFLIHLNLSWKCRKAHQLKCRPWAEWLVFDSSRVRNSSLFSMLPDRYCGWLRLLPKGKVVRERVISPWVKRLEREADHSPPVRRLECVQVYIHVPCVLMRWYLNAGEKLMI